MIDMNLLEVFCRGIKLPFQARRVLEHYPVVYDVNTKGYNLTDVRGKWIPVNESSARRHIQKKLGIEEYKQTGTYVQYIQEFLSVDLAIPLAGYKRGIT